MVLRALRLDPIEFADIRGLKTSLRPMRPDEAALFHAWATDPDVEPFWGGRGHYKGFEDFLHHWEHLYNTLRPHEALAQQAPAEYLAKCHPEAAPAVALSHM